MSVALRLYEQLTEAGEDKTRAKVIADAFEQLEERYPHLKEVATQGHMRESELRLLKEIREVEGKLQKEIENVRLEIRHVEGRLQKEIENIRLEIRHVEGKLQKEIENVRLEIRETESRLQHEIGQVRLEVKAVEIKLAETKAELVRWVVAVGLLQTTLIIGVLLKIAHLI
ncbi:hypothetical protein [Methylomonas rapida]|uniref:DUF1640 domain-containing protein n=1 Tax=Methylomonas rapida TaxID=2963939 RepID=A0ABY7GMK7_9GAMM|nr:hypothetical protein [Methylomonas rapida]WAR45747.1 hypothetical protein NM686_004335 [Methylomonas rapida]